MTNKKDSNNNDIKKNIKKTTVKAKKEVESVKKEIDEKVKEVKNLDKHSSSHKKGNFSAFLKRNTGLLVFVAIIILLVAFTILKEKSEKTDTNLNISDDISSWVADSKTDQSVVAVIALSTCHYCAQYKPIITEIAEENSLKLYWFEIDTLNEADSSALTSTYSLTQYSGSSPYTFITKNGEFINDVVGYMPKEDTLTFLKDNGVIE